MNRREAREAVFELLFETEFKQDEEREGIFNLSTVNREIEEDDYIKTTYFGVCAHTEELDALIGKHARGWKTTRISRVSRSILRLSIYEMLYCKDIPVNVSINEAIELSKKFDEESAKAFINGILNSAKNEIEGNANA
ncbi:MAG: transcription antitermination factor NusB [Ruminococcaceae bacterium]|nr:transcription antitermination factor NusB [Oscillospiraceae bacterium]